MEEKTTLPAAVLWFTGLSGSGKTTLAKEIVSHLQERKFPVEHLDGDAMRHVFPNTGFSKEERNRHIQHVGYLASRLSAHGVTVVASFISPYADAREFVRSLCPHFFEIYLSTPLEACERRDVKGLYAKARRGEMKHFTGIDDPYEKPPNPELTLNTAEVSLNECISKILSRLL